MGSFEICRKLSPYALSTVAPVYGGSSFHEGTEGERLRVELQLQALPQPTSFVWLSSNGGNSPLVVGGNIVDLGASYIEFYPVTRTDAGTYNVTSSNYAGTASFVFTVEVYCESVVFSGIGTYLMLSFLS